jgi:hypothetical protein
VVASLALAATTAASAQAALISTAACNNAALTQPFAPWGDSSSYELAPDGDFSGGASGWTLSGGARVVAGGEPYSVAGADSSSSLYLPAGASAESPFTCVDAAYPTLRFFARNDALLSGIVVQVIYDDPVVGLVPVPVGAVAASGSWQPTLSMTTLAPLGAVLSGGTAEVAIRFSAVAGASQIDDLFVDPRMNG